MAASTTRALERGSDWLQVDAVRPEQRREVIASADSGAASNVAQRQARRPFSLMMNIHMTTGHIR